MSVFVYCSLVLLFVVIVVVCRCCCDSSTNRYIIEKYLILKDLARLSVALIFFTLEVSRSNSESTWSGGSSSGAGCGASW